ncbi:MAG: LapA family protein [Acidocella sp.]
MLLGALAFGFVAGLLFHLPHRIRAHRRAKRAEKRAAELEAQISPTQDTP